MLCSNRTPFRWNLSFFFPFLPVFLVSKVAQTPTVNNQEDCWVKSQVFLLSVAACVWLWHVKNWPFFMWNLVFARNFLNACWLVERRSVQGIHYSRYRWIYGKVVRVWLRNVLSTWNALTDDWLLSPSGKAFLKSFYFSEDWYSVKTEKEYVLLIQGSWVNLIEKWTISTIDIAQPIFIIV